MCTVPSTGCRVCRDNVQTRASIDTLWTVRVRERERDTRDNRVTALVDW